MSFSVFISYAHVDNTVMPPADSGWVSTLVENLDRFLAMKLGRAEAYSHWYDQRRLKGNHSIEDILEQVRSSQLFLAILSPGWIESDFCRRELATFIETKKGNLDNRLFVIEREELAEDQTMPKPFSDITKYRFYAPDERKIMRTFAMPMPRNNDLEYFKLVEDLARDITKQLKSGPGTPPQPEGPAVFLAEVTDDLNSRRKDVRRFLDKAGITVLPTSDYRQGREEFKQSFNTDIAKSLLLVQLLDTEPGKRPPDVQEGFAWLQYNLAKSASLPIMQWRNPELDLSKVDDIKHRELLNLETVRAMPFEDFRKMITTEYERLKNPAPEVLPPAADNRSIFINADTVDRDNAERIKEHLGDRFGWSVPLSLYDNGASPDELDSDMKENLISSDGMFIVYGAVRPAWVTRQLQQFRKYSPQRTSEPRFVAVVEMPPAPKQPLSIALPKMRIIGLDRVPEVLNSI